jgi:HTH-type transcriptional regulator/antitoxin HipB
MNTTKKKGSDKNLISFHDHLNELYGAKGTPSRDLYEQEFEAFKLGVMIQELREQRKLTQEQLAQRCGTTKSYISRIENNASDIRLSTLMRILNTGLGVSLKLSLV